MMLLLPPGAQIVVASHNAGKVREIRDLVGPFGVATLSAGDLGLPEPDETGGSFPENAALKADAAAQASGLPALADDSGLVVEALGGMPGLYSARWAGKAKDFDRAMRNVEAGLQRVKATTPERRRAWFVCALCLVLPGGERHDFLGSVAGTIVWPPRGAMGFGYDPIFLPAGHDRTFGEMDAVEKHGWTPGSDRPPLSHRARAFADFAAACLGTAP